MRVYFDNAATTPLVPEVIDSMTIESIAKLFKIEFIYKIVSRFGFKNYDVKEYKITME